MKKTNRKMTVYKVVDKRYQHIPQIKMQGEWLQKTGFMIGDSIQVSCEENKIVITKNI